jgi:hypothetical protein
MEGLALRGRARLRAIDPKTGLVAFDSGWRKNLIVTVGKELVGRILVDEGGYDTGLTWCSIGTGTNAPALGDTQLQTEFGRMAVTSKTRASNVITYSSLFLAAACTAALKEAGLWGHSTAGAGADTGVLFSRVAMDYDNSGGNYDLTLDWAITIG